MTFDWPAMLLLLAAIPLGVGAYLALERRRRRRVAGYGLIAGGDGRAARPAGLRRRLPGALLVAGIALLVIGLARPQAEVGLPRNEGTVILAFDVSRSMAATDLTPTRMEAAKAAAREFVQRQPTSVLIGVVAFSDSGLSVQVPTSDQAEVLAAIERLQPQRGTSVGQGILASLDAIAKAADTRGPDYYSNRSPEPTPEPTPVPAGTHEPASIVLLTDGESNVAPDPLTAARTAADRGVRIYTVGLGTAAGTTLQLDGFTVQTQLDEASLKAIADVSGGAYFGAADQADLREVYDTLDTRLVVRPEAMEITSLFAGAGVLILALGALASVLWLGRTP